MSGRMAPALATATTEDMQAFQAARLAALRAGLGLTSRSGEALARIRAGDAGTATASSQCRHRGCGSLVATAMRRSPILPSACVSAPRGSRKAVPCSSVSADATEPLYRSLDEAQKRRFAILTRTEGPRGRQLRGRDGGEPADVAARVASDRRCTCRDPSGCARSGFAAQDGGRWLVRQAFVGKTIDGYAVAGCSAPSR